MVILELKMPPELDSIDQVPLFLVFLNLKKSYDTVDHGILLTTLDGYSAVPCMCRIMEFFWYHQEVVTRQNGYHGPHSKAIQEIT